METVRIVFQKTDRAKYISHLDLNRLVRRVIKRSKLPIWFTEGFNPHPSITFALPLSLGYESQYDLMDLKITDDNLTKEQVGEILKSSMPECIKIVDVIEPKLKMKELRFAEFTLFINCNKQVSSKINELFLQDEIIVEKKTKKGEIKSFDVKPLINKFEIKINDNGVEVYLLLPAGCEQNINPTIIFDKLSANGIEFDITNVVRGKLYDKNMALFR